MVNRRLTPVLTEYTSAFNFLTLLYLITAVSVFLFSIYAHFGMVVKTNCNWKTSCIPILWSKKPNTNFSNKYCLDLCLFVGIRVFLYEPYSLFWCKMQAVEI